MGGEWDREESVGGWGYRTSITEGQQAEIETCLNCPLPECATADHPSCPLWQAKQEQREWREVHTLIKAWWNATARGD